MTIKILDLVNSVMRYQNVCRDICMRLPAHKITQARFEEALQTLKADFEKLGIANQFEWTLEE